MSVRVASWWTLTDDSGIRLPGIDSTICCIKHDESGLECTRSAEHGGRHAAVTSDGRVWAVWS